MPVQRKATRSKQSGFVAQHVQGVPQLAHAVSVPYNTKLPYEVRYNDILTYTVAAVQEVDRQQQADKATIAALAARVAALEARP